MFTLWLPLVAALLPAISDASNKKLLISTSFVLPAISLHVTPHQGFAPMTIRVQVRLIPVDTDRLLCVIVESQDYYSDSDLTMEGAQSPKLYPAVRYRDLPAGEYHIRASVGDGRTSRAVATAVVLLY
jgi:hypothetical protein